jgi:zinc transporter ZupT
MVITNRHSDMVTKLAITIQQSPRTLAMTWPACCNHERFQPPEAIQIAFPAASAQLLTNAIAHLFVTITTNQNASFHFVT